MRREGAGGVGSAGRLRWRYFAVRTAWRQARYILPTRNSSRYTYLDRRFHTERDESSSSKRLIASSMVGRSSGTLHVMSSTSGFRNFKQPRLSCGRSELSTVGDEQERLTSINHSRMRFPRQYTSIANGFDTAREGSLYSGTDLSPPYDTGATKCSPGEKVRDKPKSMM